eukprot:899030-Prymnesium_polylepis.1
MRAGGCRTGSSPRLRCAVTCCSCAPAIRCRQPRAWRLARARRAERCLSSAQQWRRVRCHLTQRRLPVATRS